MDSMLKETRVDMFGPALKPRVLFAGDEWVGQPYMLLAEDAVVVYGSPTGGLAVSEQFGITLQNRLSLFAAPDQISFGGGYWRLNPQLLSCIGSSAAIPVPWLVHDKPEILKSSGPLEKIVKQLESL